VQSGITNTKIPVQQDSSTNQVKISIEKYRKTIRPEGWISQAEAARIRGVSQQAIDNLVKRNRFKTLKFGGKTLLNLVDIASYQPHPPGPRPDKNRIETEPTLSQGTLLSRARQSEGRILSKKNESANRLRILTEQSQQTVKPEDWISQAEAARIRGVSQPAIVNLIRRGRLTTVNMAGRTVVLRSEIENFIARPKGVRPPMKATNSKTSKEKKLKK
jgi:predicted DNA-binding protein (UPF0251 family)